MSLSDDPRAVAAAAAEPNASAEPEKAKRKRGGTPFDDIESPEVRAHALIEHAFSLVDQDARERLAYSVNHKYGPKPPVLIPNL